MELSASVSRWRVREVDTHLKALDNPLEPAADMFAFAKQASARRAIALCSRSAAELSRAVFAQEMLRAAGDNGRVCDLLADCDIGR